MKIWPLKLPFEHGPGRALNNCDRQDVHCIAFDARLKVAVFIQACQRPAATSPGDALRLRIAYRTFHPEPIKFKRSASTKGGMLANHDAEEVMEFATGRTEGRPYLEALVPDAIALTPGPVGSQVSMRMQSVADKPVAIDAQFSLMYPQGGLQPCPCC